MRIEDVAFCTTVWDTVPATEHKGETGVAIWRTLETGNIRVRMVEYTPGYRADHWCGRGHALLVLAGELVTELCDGCRFVTTPGTSYQGTEDTEPHRSGTTIGAKLFIVD
jgi:hypothetical protein